MNFAAEDNALRLNIRDSVSVQKSPLWVLVIGTVLAITIFSLVLCLPIISLAEPIDNWNLRYDPSYWLENVTYGNGLFVAVGDDGKIVTSPDGITWTQRTSGSTQDLYGVTYGNGLFVVVGDHGSVIISADGEIWIQRTPYVGTINNLSDITYGKGLFVAVGDFGTVVTSYNGYDWEVRNYESTILPYFPYRVTYGENVFIAVGVSGRISSSIDGVHWIPRDSGTYGNFYDVTYGDGFFVAVGELGRVFTSPDGITWQLRNTGISDDLTSVIYGSCTDTFLATVRDFSNDPYIITSSDGIAWTARFPQVGSITYRSAFGNGTFIIVGSAIYQSDSIPLTFSDVPSGFWAEAYIKAISSAGITTGYTDCTYRPSDNVSRAQMAAFIIRSEFGDNFSYSSTQHFTDIPDTHWVFKYVQKMYDEGITTGYEDGTYRPSQNVTRGQMAAFIIRALYGDTFSYTLTPYFSDVPETQGLFKYIQKMYDEGITTGYADGTYRPSQNVSRAQMATFIAKAFLGM